MPEHATARGVDQHRLLVKIVFLDKPDDYRRQPRSCSSMVEAPEKLRVALHRDALGVYDILGPADRPLQESLWREVTYWRASHRGDVAEYTVRPREAC